MKYKYQLYIDGALAYEGDHIRYLKERAQFEFDYCNAFSAKIMHGQNEYAYKKWDGEWRRITRVR